VNDLRAAPAPLTAQQRMRVEEALPEARRLAKKLGGRAPSIEHEELLALGRAVLVASVRDFDATRGTTLAQYAYKAMRGAMLRAIRKLSRDPLTAAQLAMTTHEEAIDDRRNLVVEIAETEAEKRARARALGENAMTAAYFAYRGQACQASPEDDLAGREEHALVRSAVSSLGRENAALLDLLYWQDLDWESAAERLGISVSSAQRLENKLIPRLKAALTARGIQGISPSGE
jgi:RNA polymerase sigma factor (sigma-70 family)